MIDMTPAAAELSADKSEAATDISNFRSWMVAEQRRIYLLCLRLLRNTDEANSATQDAFLKAYRAIEKRGGEALEDRGRWLTRIAVNTCLDRLRSRRWLFWQRQASNEDEQAILQLARATDPSPEAALLAREIAWRLSKALDKLSARQRSVFVLRHDEDRSLEEIGDLLGLDVGTVKAHMARALRKLRDELRDLYGRKTLD